MGVSKNNGTPKWMVYNGKPYEQMDDLGVLPPYFWFNTHMVDDKMKHWYTAENTYIIKSTLKIARYCPLVIQGFSNFLVKCCFKWLKPANPEFPQQKTHTMANHPDPLDHQDLEWIRRTAWILILVKTIQKPNKKWLAGKFPTHEDVYPGSPVDQTKVAGLDWMIHVK